MVGIDLVAAIFGAALVAILAPRKVGDPPRLRVFLNSLLVFVVVFGLGSLAFYGGIWMLSVVVSR